MHLRLCTGSTACKRVSSQTGISYIGKAKASGIRNDFFQAGERIETDDGNMMLGLYGIQGCRQGVVEGNRDRCSPCDSFRAAYPALWCTSQVWHVWYKKIDRPGVSKILNGCYKVIYCYSRFSKGVCSGDERVSEIVGAAPYNVQRRGVSLVKKMLD